VLDSLITATAASAALSPATLALCTAASLLLGLCVSALYMYRNTYSKGLVVTLALLPAMVQLVITIVNGNLGAGVAVMGAFSLVRFRSIPGSARDISSIFLAMALGLATGMGYLTAALLFLAVVGGAMLLLNTMRFGEKQSAEKELRITIPENLDTAGLFDDLFASYTRRHELVRIRTTNMGSLYELQYRIQLTSAGIEKPFIDELRCRTGNLSIAIGRVSAAQSEL